MRAFNSFINISYSLHSNKVVQNNEGVFSSGDENVPKITVTLNSDFNASGYSAGCIFTRPDGKNVYAAALFKNMNRFELAIPKSCLEIYGSHEAEIWINKGNSKIILPKKITYEVIKTKHTSKELDFDVPENMTLSVMDLISLMRAEMKTVESEKDDIRSDIVKDAKANIEVIQKEIMEQIQGDSDKLLEELKEELREFATNVDIGNVDFSKYVVKEEGKGLSSNDFTTAEKEKLNLVEDNANNYIHPESHDAETINQSSERMFVSEEEKSRWNSKSEFSGSYEDLENKPFIPSKLSDLPNDSEFITSNHEHDTRYYVKLEVDQKIADAVTGGTIDLSAYATKLEVASGYVRKEEGKTLSSNDYTDTERLKLSSLSNYVHPSSHSAEMIEQNKDYRFVSDSEKETWSNKSEFSGNYEDLNNKPAIPTVDVDRSYVDAELAKKANSEDVHAHSNKASLDLLTPSKIAEWNSKSEFSGSYTDLSDKPSIPVVDVTKSYVDSELLKKADKLSMHDHSNKLVLDNVTAEKISEWNSKSEFSGSYEDLANAPAIPSRMSDLDNDLNFITASHEHDSRYYKKDEVDKKITDAVTGGTVDLSGYLTTTDAEETYAKIESLNSKVDKVSGKGLSSNDFTTAEKEKLSNLSNYTHPETHQAAIIEQTPTHRFVTDEEKLEWSLKSNFSGAYGELTGKPDLSALHSHSNGAALNSITNSKISEWNSKSDFSGNYEDLAGKPFIPVVDVTKSYVDSELAKKAEKSDLHSHSNMSALTEITAERIVSWNEKSEFSGSYEDLTGKPSIPSKTSHMENDSGFVTVDHNHSDRYYEKADVDKKITDAVSKVEIDLSDYLTKEEIESEFATIAFADGKVNKEAGKQLSTNDYTDIEKDKLSKLSNYIHPDTHEPSVIIQDPWNRFVTDNEKEVWNSKSEFSGSYEDLANKPYIPSNVSELANDIGYVTASHEHSSLYYEKEEVDKKISDAVANVEVDLSGHLTKAEAEETYASKELEHRHSNTELLESINFEKIQEWDNKSTFSGSYADLTNKPTIPTVDVDKAYVDSGLALKLNIADSHSHTNKTTLDGITAEKVSSWDNKSEFSGNYLDLSNRPYIPSNISDLTNDVGYITINHNHDVRYYDKATVDQKIVDAAIEGQVDLTGYLTKTEATSTYATIALLTGKVDKVDGKGLSTNDYTTAEKNKLAGLSNYTHPSTHEASMIVQNASYRFVTDTEKNTWNNKSNFSGSYDDLTNKPTIPIVDVTKSYVDTQLATKANTTDLHSHSNKAVIDGITSEKITEWNNKSTFDGNYNNLTNKPTIPTVDVTKSYVDTQLATKANTADLHTHSNKTVLDGITSAKITSWDGKSNFDGNYNSLSNKPSLFSGNYNDLTNKPTIPTVPTAISSFTNDTGYITMVKNTRDNSEVKFWVGTKAQYDAISTKDANTIYNVIES